MEKVYSSANILNDNSSLFFKSIDKLIGVSLDIQIPSAHITRLTTICRDFRKKTSSSLFIDRLIQILVEEFVEEVIETSNLKEIYRRIIEMDHSIIIHDHEVNTKTKIHSLPVSYFEDLYIKRIIFKYDHIHRLEVALSDLDTIQEHEYTAEKLIGFLVSSFVINVQNSGLGKVIEELCYRLNLGEEYQ